MDWKLKGTVETKGAAGMSANDPTQGGTPPVVKRAILIWLGAVAVLLVMHVGGSTIER